MEIEMTSDMEKWNDKIQWVRNGFLHGKDFDKAQPIVDDFDLSDENLLQVLTCLEKYRKENHLNEGLEYLKSNNKQNYWIGYYSLDEQETKKYDNFCYFNLVSDFVKTKVLKAKVLGKWSECCESIKIHRINENRIFAGFIKNCDCLTDGEKDQILN